MKQKHIFLIDDDRDDREFFQLAIGKIGGCTITIAYDGVHAFEQMQSPGFLIPDIIFLDINMPRMHGREFLKEFRKQTAYSTIPVVAISTSSSPNDMEQMANLGANSYLVKALSIAQLKTDIEQVIQKHS